MEFFKSTFCYSLQNPIHRQPRSRLLLPVEHFCQPNTTTITFRTSFLLQTLLQLPMNIQSFITPYSPLLDPSPTSPPALYQTHDTTLASTMALDSQFPDQKSKNQRQNPHFQSLHFLILPKTDTNSWDISY
jgi:hypothetical protein